MAGSGDRYLSYDVHGSGVESLAEGLANLAMAPARQRAAKEIVGELLTLNSAERFVWYLPPATPEVCAYWNDAPTNLLWITNVGVHLKRDGPVTPLARPITYEKQDGDYIGWLLPGAEAGTGGGARPSEITTVLCPVTSLRQPAGSLCPDCEIIHP
jgi:hypothetical protein